MHPSEMNGRLMHPLVLEFNQNVFDFFVDCLQVAIKIPTCVTLISEFNGYRDRHLMAQGQALRILELLICYAGVIILWLIRGGFLLDSRVQARRCLTQEPVGFQAFSQRLCPSCLKGSHPPPPLSIPAAQSALLSPSTVMQSCPVGTASPGCQEKLLLSQSHAVDVCCSLLCLLDKCFTCVSECRAGCWNCCCLTGMLAFVVAAQTRWSWCGGCSGVQTVLVIQGIHTSALKDLNWK